MPQNPGAELDIFVARQPVFDRLRKIWGYELLFRHSEAVNKAEVSDEEAATQSVIADGYAMAFSGVPASVMCLVNFSRGLLLQDTALALPAENSAIEVLETVAPDPEVIEACKKIKKQGYMLALDDFVGEPGYEPLLELADLIKVDVLNMDQTEIYGVAELLRPYGCRMLAEKVETDEVFGVCREAGFSLFQGFFFSHPEIIPGRKLAVGEISRLELLKELSREEVDFSKLAEIVQKDISLTYRLFRYINSAAFSLTHKVESTQRALTLMGYMRLKEWLRVVILTEMGSGDIGREIVNLSAKRGKFMQLLAPQLETDLGSESLFLFGFLSLLDVLLRRPMQEIVDELPLNRGLKAALLGGKGTLSRLISLNKAQERGNWEEVGRLLDEMGLDLKKSARALNEARDWSNTVLGSAD
ncbi:MAG: EAL and HDOD domain-containing protein [Desulfonatronovibrionaceae bacterium]